MNRPHDVTASELRAALAEAQDATTATRIVAGIATKHGVTRTDLAEWFDVERKTIHNWLTRLEEAPLLEGARDDDRSGRPAKLTQRQRARVDRVLRDAPRDTQVTSGSRYWTPRLLQQYIRETFGVSYSIPSCRRLLRDAGLRFVTPVAAADLGYDPERVRTETGGGPGRRGVWVPAST